MGHRGPPPTPTELKRLRGNPGCRRLNDDEPKPAKGAPRMPAWMGRVAKDKWASTLKELSKLGVMTIVDGDALATYCVTWGRWRAAEAALEEHGQTMTVNGAVKARPEVSIAAKLVLVVRQYQREFGLTPSSRSALTVPRPAGVPDGFVRIAKTG